MVFLRIRSLPRVLIAVYFVGMTVGFLWLLANSELWCQESPSDGHESHNEHSGYNRVSSLEAQLRRHFPLQIEAILAETDSDVPYIYAITPTYDRLVQKAELTRLIHTFLHVRNFHWILVEDAKYRTEKVRNLLKASGIKYTHLAEPTPEDFKTHANDPNWLKPRGVPQRNRALQWLLDNRKAISIPSVIYFADDDNTYSLEVFEEMRQTSKVSVWPVGLVGKMLYESPILDKDHKVSEWHTYWHPERPFASDMAGFAISTGRFFHHQNARFNVFSARGYLESDFILQLGITLPDLEPKADLCTKVLVWHTRTEEPNLKSERKLEKLGKGSERNIEI